MLRKLADQVHLCLGWAAVLLSLPCCMQALRPRRFLPLRDRLSRQRRQLCGGVSGEVTHICLGVAFQRVRQLQQQVHQLLNLGRVDGREAVQV